MTENVSQKFNERLSFTVFKAENTQQHALVYFDGVPLVDAIMEDNYVMRVRLFDTLFMAMYEPEWVYENGIGTCWPEERWENEEDEKAWLTFLAQTPCYFEDLIQPLPFETWIQGVSGLLNEAMETIDVESLKETVLEKAFAEIKSDAHREAMRIFIHHRMREVCGFDQNSPWIIKLGKRQVRAEPILNDQGKTLFLFFTGRGNRAVPMGALWWNHEERYFKGDRKLSVFFNADEDNPNLIWFDEEGFSIPYLIYMLKSSPEMFAFEKNEERRAAWPWFYWCGLQYLMPPHDIAEDLFIHFDWMRDLPIEGKNKQFKLFMALFLFQVSQQEAQEVDTTESQVAIKNLH